MGVSKGLLKEVASHENSGGDSLSLKVFPGVLSLQLSWHQCRQWEGMGRTLVLGSGSWGLPLVPDAVALSFNFLSFVKGI